MWRNKAELWRGEWREHKEPKQKKNLLVTKEHFLFPREFTTWLNILELSPWEVTFLLVYYHLMLIFSSTGNISYFLEISHHFSSGAMLGARYSSEPRFPPPLLTQSLFSLSAVFTSFFCNHFDLLLLPFSNSQSMWSLHNTSHLHWILRNPSLWFAILVLWPPHATSTVAETLINIRVNRTVQEKYRTLRYKTVKNVTMATFKGVVCLGELKGLAGYAKVLEF